MTFTKQELIQLIQILISEKNKSMEEKLNVPSTSSSDYFHQGIIDGLNFSISEIDKLIINKQQ